MKYSWFKTVFPIAAIFSFRMLGLFLLIPVFTLYAGNLKGATPTLIGLALGGYGLTQGILQMPFGLLSDVWGRKPVLTLGLLFFAGGSLLGALTHSIYGMIAARTLQGTGAIGSVLIALLADLTPDEQRTKAMAVIGMTIGTSFSLAMIVSPAISAHFGLTGIFYLTTILAFAGIILLHAVIPTPSHEPFPMPRESKSKTLKSLLKNSHLQKLNIGIFCQHFILTSTFFALPMLLNQQVRIGHLSQQWHFYLPLMIFSFLAMIPFIMIAEKKNLMKPILLFSIVTTAIAQNLLIFVQSNWLGLCCMMLFYFIVFNILEAALPSLVSKQAPPKNKGSAMGIYSTSQFLGIFAGGSLAGVLYQWQQSTGIFVANSLLSIFWLIIAYSMKPEDYLSTLKFNYPENSVNHTLLLTELLKIPGTKEVNLASEEKSIYIRVNKKEYQEGSAELIINSPELLRNNL